MWRMNNEEGATAVVVALMTLVLLGFGAIAVDAGQIYQERRELQNGADAAVLAAAQDCADPTTAPTCVVTSTGSDCVFTTVGLEDRIDEYANANANDAASDACVYELDLTDQFITVETETLAGGNGFLTHWFGWALNRDSTTVRAQATAAWGVAGAGSTVPLTFSYCEWIDLVPDLSALPSVSETIFFHDGAKTDPEGCVGPAGQDSPGGFGWLDTDGSGDCEAAVTAEGEAEGDTGTDIPKECDAAFWSSLIGETILVPIFSEITGTGTSATYYIEGFAAFVLEGYRLGGDPKYNHPTPPPCNGDERCIRGYFTDYVAYGDYIDPDGAYYGAQVVTLIK